METHLEFYRRWARLAKPYFKWQFEQFSPYLGRKVADIGCGLGNFTEFLKDRELYLGLEPDQELAYQFKILHGSGKIRLAANGDITTAESVGEIKANHIDSILCVNVLEHIPDDRAGLINLLRGVDSGCYICILVPALTWLFGTLDKLDRHYRRYSKKSLVTLTEGLPVKIINIYYLNLIGALGWFLKGRIFQEKAYADYDYGVMNLLIPIVSRLENLVKPPIGLSFILILQKI